MTIQQLKDEAVKLQGSTKTADKKKLQEIEAEIKRLETGDPNTTVLAKQINVFGEVAHIDFIESSNLYIINICDHLSNEHAIAFNSGFYNASKMGEWMKPDIIVSCVAEDRKAGKTHYLDSNNKPVPHTKDGLSGIRITSGSRGKWRKLITQHQGLSLLKKAQEDGLDEQAASSLIASMMKG